MPILIARKLPLDEQNGNNLFADFRRIAKLQPNFYAKSVRESNFALQKTFSRDSVLLCNQARFCYYHFTIQQPLCPYRFSKLLPNLYTFFRYSRPQETITNQTALFPQKSNIYLCFYTSPIFYLISKISFFQQLSNFYDTFLSLLNHLSNFKKILSTTLNFRDTSFFL